MSENPFIKLLSGSIYPVDFVYKNYRGEVAVRTAVINEIYWGSTPHHPEPQWLAKGIDVDKREPRTYALKDMSPVPAKEPEPVAPASQIVDGEDFTISIQLNVSTLRTDLPRSFTWRPTKLQRLQARKNHKNKTLEDLRDRGGVSYQELAAIMECRPWSSIPEMRAVRVCLLKAPQKGFVL